MNSPGAAMDILAQIRDAIRSRASFLITSHARPDGDSIGSQLALAAALRAARQAGAHREPRSRRRRRSWRCPGSTAIEVAPRVEGASTR